MSNTQTRNGLQMSFKEQCQYETQKEAQFGMDRNKLTAYVVRETSTRLCVCVCN